VKFRGLEWGGEATPVSNGSQLPVVAEKTRLRGERVRIDDRKLDSKTPDEYRSHFLTTRLELVP
jgi:hypothetical protein